MNYRFFTKIIFILLVPISLFGQHPKGWSYEPSVHIGKVFKHSSDFEPDVKGISLITELNISKQTYGNRYWEENHNYLSYGVSLFHGYYGDNEIFGQSIGAYPHFTYYFMRKRIMRMHFRYGFGVAYITKPYDHVTNPTNNVIGSHLNNMTGFRIGSDWFLSDRISLLAALTFTHYSNGSGAQPNLGINVPAVNVGIKYTPNPASEEEYIHHEAREIDKRFYASINFAGARRETSAAKGPKYPIYVVSAEVKRQWHKNNLLALGMEYENNRSVYEFMSYIQLYGDDERKRQLNATRLGVTLANETRMGNISMVVGAGAYVTKSYQQQFPIYFKLTARYYVPLPFAKEVKPFVLVGLKAHISVAEYIYYGMGISF